MGVHLALYPLHGKEDLAKTEAYFDTRLPLDQDYRVYGLFADFSYVKEDGVPQQPVLSPQAISPQLWVRGLDVKQLERKDDYDEPLTFLYAEDMYELSLPKDVSERTKAAMAYIKMLPRFVPIILWWR